MHAPILVEPVVITPPINVHLVDMVPKIEYTVGD